jgi:hypothetical protein
VKRDDAVKCTAILQTSKNMDNPDMKEPHSHHPDENAITIAKCRDDMKRKAKLTLDKPNHIFTHDKKCILYISGLILKSCFNMT